MDVLRDVFTFISVVGVAFLGTLIYLNSSKNLANINFLGVCSSLSLWILANFFADRDIQSLFWSRVAFTSITLGAFFFFEFACSFPTRRHVSRVTNSAVILLTVLLVVIEQTDYFIPHTFISDGISNVDTGSLYLFFPAYILLVFGGGIFVLVKGRKKLNDMMKSQTDIVIFGIVLMAIVGFVTNLILPIILGNDKLASIGTFSTLFFASFTAYAMVRHRLFDIREAVARSLGYVLVLGSMISIYAIGLFGIIDVISRSASQETLRQVLSIILLVPLAISFQYIKNFFDKVTNRLFYQESYDFQEVLNRVGKVVEAEIDLGKVLGGTRTVLSDALKSSFVEFLLIRDNQKSFNVKETKLEPYIGELNKHLGTQHSELLTSDELSPDSSLWKSFNESRVAISLRLRTQKQVVGYILLGEKRNGGRYSSQDKHLLTIVASEIAVTVQNALRFEEIQHFNITLQQKIDEATKELRHTNKRLKLLDETKDDFISMASHQLRTPLTSVKGYISLVLDGDAGPIKPNQRKLLDQAYVSSQRMVFLIADLLNVSRLKTGKFIIEPTAINLADLVHDEVQQLIETAQGRKLTLSYEKPSHFPVVDLDETKTRQVIMNFIDNAIYYTPAGGHISVSLNETQRSIELRVTDDGIGVPRDVQHHLFSKFFRASNAQKARPDGTGLGLFMAKKVIVAQGGAIIFTSQEGKGSTFGFTFPKIKPHEIDGSPITS